MLGFVKVLREYERAVFFRFGRLLDPPRGPGPRLEDPDRRPAREGRPPDDHAQHPATGRDHEGQRPGPGQRRRLLQDRRPEGRDRPGRELHGRDVSDRADDAARGARPARARRAALGAREDQLDPADDHRRSYRPLGDQGLDRRGQGRRDPRRDAEGDGTPGRGRARAPRQDHQLRGRVPGGGEAEGRRHRARAAPDGAAAALPADAIEVSGTPSSTIIFPAPIDIIKPFLERAEKKSRTE